jgi:hypothetical protein
LEVQRPCGARTESSRLGAGGNFTPYTRYCMYIHTYILTPGSVGAGDSGGLVCWSPSVLGCWSLLSSGSSLSFVLHNLSVHPRDEKRPSWIYLPTYTKIPTTPYRIKARTGGLQSPSAQPRPRKKRGRQTLPYRLSAPSRALDQHAFVFDGLHRRLHCRLPRAHEIDNLL